MADVIQKLKEKKSDELKYNRKLQVFISEVICKKPEQVLHYGFSNS